MNPQDNPQSSAVELLLQRNMHYANEYKESSLVQLIQSPRIEDELTRKRLLDCIQVFSNYFQKVVMLRSVFCDDQLYLPIVTEHLKDEFGHNLSLLKDRDNKAPIWDPVLDATSCWFSWKMLSLDNDEKTVLVHLVLETSANIFFQEAQRVMQQYKETDYFAIHEKADVKHEKMGIEIFTGIHPKSLNKLLMVQKQGWDVLNAACDRIAELSGIYAYSF